MLVVGVARQRDVDGAQIAARREREPRFEQARLRQRREERRQVLEPQEAAAQREVLDAVGIALDVDVDGRGLGPGAAGARDGDVAQRKPPRVVGALPVARQRDALETRVDGAERALQRHVGERELRGAAREHALLPLEPDGHVAAARLRRDGRRREQPRRDREIDVVDVGRKPPIARELRAGIASSATKACAVSSMWSANSAGGRALASSVSTSSTRRRLPATS